MSNVAHLPVHEQASLTDRAMLVSLTIKKPSNSKQDKDSTAEVTASHHAAEGSARVSKTLFDKEAVQSFNSPANQARTLLYDKTLPWGQHGIRILLVENYFNLMEGIKPLETAFWSAVEKFKEKREDHVEQARLSLGTLFKEDDYPSREELEADFAFDLKFMPLTDADDWRVRLGSAEEERITKRIHDQMEAAINEAAKEPWRRVKDAAAALAERLETRSKQEKDDKHEGKLTPIKEALIGNLLDLARSLDGLNITKDPRLGKIGKEIENMLQDTSASDLKGSPDMQTYIAKQARGLEAKVDQYAGLL